MAIYLKRDVTFSDGTIKKGTKVSPVRDQNMIRSLETSFSDIWAHRMRKDFVPCNIKGKDRWLNRRDIA